MRAFMRPASISEWSCPHRSQQLCGTRATRMAPTIMTTRACNTTKHACHLVVTSDQPIAMLLDAVVIERSVLVTTSPKTGLTFTNATDEQAQQEPAH